MTTASHIALLAPVPKEHLDDGLKTVSDKGKVAFGSRKWEIFRDLDALAGEGVPVDVYIYESEGRGKHNSTISWRGRYIGHVRSEMGAHPKGLKYRPESTTKYVADNSGHWAVFWELDSLEPVSTWLDSARKR
jgi:hypothetical protein